jgi:ATP-dependent RNA helicase MSS116
MTNPPKNNIENGGKPAPAAANSDSKKQGPSKRGNSSRNRRGQQKKVKNDASPAEQPKAPTPADTDDTTAPVAASGGNLLVTDSKFADLPISAESRRALAEVFKYEFMTPVQEETVLSVLEGEDCLAKAKTGTGKTLAFLIPTIERILQRQDQKRASDIGSLIISPTRELAFQITKEAESMLRFHKDTKVVSLVGGTNIKKDITNLKGRVQIVVATPGRLLDHLQNNGLAARMVNLDVLILDEADQLLDMGFRPDIERILRLVDASSKSRQTLLFSATVPESVEEISRLALRPQYRFFDTVGADVDQTHLHVGQELIVTSQKDQLTALASILERETTQEPYKVIVFFTTARMTGFCADFFRNANSGYEIVDIHSRKSQPQRAKASDAFRKAKNAILFSSDVSARGMDYPDVTFVLQVGLTERSQYIHRLGRTARAGKEGKGALLVATYEARHMKHELSDMPLEDIKAPPASPATADMVNRGILSVSTNEAMEVAAQQAYAAWLGYYKGNLRKCGWKPVELVEAANQWAKDVGLSKQPRLEAKTVGKMGLKGVPGLLIGGNSGGGGGGSRGPPRNGNNTSRSNSRGPSRSNSESEGGGGPRRPSRNNNNRR